MSLPLIKTQHKTYLRLMAECLSALNGDSVPTAEETIRLSLISLGHEAVLQQALKTPPRLSAKRWLHRFRRNRRALLHELTDEVYASAGISQPELDLPQLAALTLAVDLQRELGVLNGD